MLVEGEGTWKGTANATLSENRLKVDSLTSSATLDFAPAVEKDLSAGTLVYSMTSRFSAMNGLPECNPLAKCGLSVSESDAGEKSYCGIVKDPSSSANGWALLDGPAPNVDADVAVTIEMKQVESQSLVRYQVDGEVLTLNGVAWLELAPVAEMTGAVAFGGIGSVASLSAGVEGGLPAETVVLTIPALDHLSVKHVKVAGIEVVSNEDGTYTVEKGSVVIVTFAPEAGYALNGNTMSFVVRDNMELPEAGRPSVTDVQNAITINEVMAKNGVTIRTKKGFEGLDWVELYNSGDDDLDLTDPNAPYYMGNDPTKKPNKWTPIQGSCIVPAHGYKIVWFDGDELCKDDGFAEDEAFVRANLSTDANKHTVFLASAADASKIIQQITLPGGIKDISYGLGNLSRTLVAENAAAEYRVGTGAWKPVDGPIGMSAQAGGFTVTTYTINGTVANMDTAEAQLRDPSLWTQVATNAYPQLAFAGVNQAVNFDKSLYRGFDTTAAQNFIVTATGTVLIPESGDWTFDVCSDDGFAASLNRLGKKWSWEARGTRGYQHSTATFNLEAGSYEIKLTYFQQGGGAALDLSAAKGRLAFDAAKFQLVGAAGSAIVHAGALGAQVAADVAAEMVNKATTAEWKTTFTMDEAPAAEDTFRLLLRYADGFTAKLNGEVVAEAPATAARPAGEALMRQTFAIPAAKVKKGVNTLEVTGINNAIDDTEFYLSPELKWDIADKLFVYSTTPTPGAANAAEGHTGFTPKVTFSVPHGWKDAAFDLELSCVENPAAVIYYTLDGTSPKVGAEGTFRYEEPIPINKTTVVRAAVPDVDSILQQDASATYLFYADVIQQGAETPAGFPKDNTVNSQRFYYGMAKAITEGDADTQARLKRGFTEACRTVSLVIDPKNLFDGASGIYVNASGNGRDWERQTMAEQINPMVKDGSDDFSVAAGLRIRGAFSRGADKPKHSFRLFFRSEYGMGTLKHALFGNEAGAATEFEKIDLRTSQNYAWSQNSDGDTFIHETWSRDSERDLGSTYNRSRYYNLFINGVYWGLYQTEERVDQNYCESYNGGVAENYDVVRTSQPGYNTGIVEGDTAAWTELWRITTQEGYGEGHEANYKKVLGLNPDGTRNPAYPVLLNVTNLICHIFTAHFAEDADSPVNSSGMANNIIAFRNRNDGEGQENGFLWNRHDAEHSLGYGGGANQVKALIWGTEEHQNPNRDLFAIGNFNPNLLNYELLKNAEYRQIFSDLVYEHMVRKGGALTTEAALARYEARMAELDDVIVCESARWGYQYGGSHNRALWLSKCNERLDFIRNRLRYLIPEYQRRGWYTSTETPQLVDGTGAPVEEGTTIGKDEKIFLTAGGEGAQIYYTLDGTDPRGADGQPADGATLASEGLRVPPTGLALSMRVLGANGEWSALATIAVKGEEILSTQVEAVRVAAVYSSTTGSGNEGEFVVLTNITEHAVMLEGIKINCAKDDGKSPFKTICTLTGGRLEAHSAVQLNQADLWPSGKITNGAVIMRVTDASDGEIQYLKFSSKWFKGLADGTGDYLIAKDFGTSVTEETLWYPSCWPNGVPPKPADWPEDPETEITEETTPSDLGITEGAFAEATPAELKKLAKWAKAKGVPFAGESVNAMAFDAAGNPATDFAKAYLLNCALEDVEDAEASFKFQAIEPGKEPTIEGDFNGTLKVYGATTLENGGDWATDKPNAKFYKATLTR